MSTFIIDVPVPSMGATVSELTIVSVAVAPGARVAKGQKLAELESDKSSFDFESPAEGTILEVKGAPGSVKSSGQALFRMETADQSLKHLEVTAAKAAGTTDHGQQTTARAAQTPNPKPQNLDPKSQTPNPIWTPRALKLAQEAGLDPAKISDIEATGPGGRVSGDDVTKYLAGRK